MSLGRVLILCYCGAEEEGTERWGWAAHTGATANVTAGPTAGATAAVPVVAVVEESDRVDLNKVRPPVHAYPTIHLLIPSSASLSTGRDRSVLETI
jgi:hypothetical protein